MTAPRIKIGDRPAGREQRSDPRPGAFPALRIGVVSGVTGILCCVGPTVLALLGIVSAGTAYTWANDLYDGYAWWFRLAGLTVLALLGWLARRRACSIDGVKRLKRRRLGAVAVAVVTYATLYGVTTWLGAMAH